MSFFEIQFPSSISYNSDGGPRYATTVVGRLNGRETRKPHWSYPIHYYNAATGVRELADIENILSLFHITSGPAHGFRYKDWADYKTVTSTGAVSHNDMNIGTGDGVTVDFQLTKTYTSGAETKTRVITKPVSGTVLIGLNGVNQGSGWTLNTITGVVTFSVAPSGGVAVTWGGEFDVPCRFESESLPTTMSSYNHGQADIPIKETRDFT